MDRERAEITSINGKKFKTNPQKEIEGPYRMQNTWNCSKDLFFNRWTRSGR